MFTTFEPTSLHTHGKFKYLTVNTAVGVVPHPIPRHVFAADVFAAGSSKTGSRRTKYNSTSKTNHEKRTRMKYQVKLGLSWK